MQLEEARAAIKALIHSNQKQRIQEGLPANAKDALNRATEIVWDHLQERGKIFQSGGLGYLLLEDNIPVAVSKDGHDFAYTLNDYDLQPGAKEKDHVGKYIGMMCAKKGEKVDFRLSAHYDPSTNTAYMAELRGQMLRITVDKVERVPNGTDGVLFLFPENYDEVDILSCRQWQPFPMNTFLNLTLFAGVAFQESPLTDDEKKQLLMVYLVALFLPGIVRERLILTLLGPTGSGKTYFLRIIGQLLMGRHFEVSELAHDIRELETVLVNSPFVVLDEAGGIPSSVVAVLKKTVTGGKMQRRELYTTSCMIEEPYRAQIAISTLVSPFHNQEEMNRQLTVTLQKRDGYVDEADLLRKVAQHRPWFLSEMVTKIQMTLGALESQRDYRPTMPVRLAGFATLFAKLMRAEFPIDGEDRAMDILNRWRLEQEQGVFSNSDLAEAIQNHITSPEFISGEALTTTAFLEQLKKHCSGRPYWAENPERLAHALLRSEEAFHNAFGLEIVPDSHGKGKLYKLTPPSKPAAQEEEQPFFA